MSETCSVCGAPMENGKCTYCGATSPNYNQSPGQGQSYNQGQPYNGGQPYNQGQPNNGGQPYNQGQPYNGGQPYYGGQPNSILRNVQPNIGQPAISPKSRTVSLILCLLLGYLGIHYFYVGKVGMGILYLFTGGLCGLGVLVNLIQIICGNFTDQFGFVISEW